MHREVEPARRCWCGVWLSSYNLDPVCVEHGGWKAQQQKETKRAHETRSADFADLLAA